MCSLSRLIKCKTSLEKMKRTYLKFELENYHGCEITLFSDTRTYTTSAWDGVVARLPTHSGLRSRDSHFEFQDSFCNEPAGLGERIPARRAEAFSCEYRHVLVLFFACQKTETASNIVDTWCCSRTPSHLLSPAYSFPLAEDLVRFWRLLFRVY